MPDWILQALGFGAAIVTIVGYYLAAKRDKISLFNYVNVATSTVLAPLNIHYGAYFSAGLNIAYGAIGVYGIWVDRRAIQNAGSLD